MGKSLQDSSLGNSRDSNLEHNQVKPRMVSSLVSSLGHSLGKDSLDHSQGKGSLASSLARGSLVSSLGVSQDSLETHLQGNLVVLLLKGSLAVLRGVLQGASTRVPSKV